MAVEFAQMVAISRAVIAVVVVGLLVAIAEPASADTSIRSIVEHPDDYANQQVTVVGTVVAPSLGHLGESFYTLLGDDRRINVVSHAPAPAVGDRLQVSAKVGRRPPDEEFNFPPVLFETSRQQAN